MRNQKKIRSPMLDSLRQHLRQTSKATFEKEWAEVKVLNLEGPTIEEFLSDKSNKIKHRT